MRLETLPSKWMEVILFSENPLTCMGRAIPHSKLLRELDSYELYS
jgi:hypothetical protein